MSAAYDFWCRSSDPAGPASPRHKSPCHNCLWSSVELQPFPPLPPSVAGSYVQRGNRDHKLHTLVDCCWFALKRWSARLLVGVWGCSYEFRVENWPRLLTWLKLEGGGRFPNLWVNLKPGVHAERDTRRTKTRRQEKPGSWTSFEN